MKYNTNRNGPVERNRDRKYTRDWVKITNPYTTLTRQWELWTLSRVMDDWWYFPFLLPSNTAPYISLASLLCPACNFPFFPASHSLRTLNGTIHQATDSIVLFPRAPARWRWPCQALQDPRPMAQFVKIASYWTLTDPRSTTQIH